VSWARPEDAESWQRQFGERLRELRRRQGMSQMDLAHKADMDATYLSAVERGRRNLGLVNMHVLAQSLGVKVAELFPD
jgi:transcriptional regulator with XRE-family HTH domain